MLDFYHCALAVTAAAYHRYPSNKMVVIGVTGTNGKTTVVHLISHILEEAGYKVGRVSSIDFKIGGNVRRNSLKMTMPGRFFLQKLLKDMVIAGCDYVVMEVTSEGIKQFRHKGINFDIGVFTNLTPEHIERHGGFEKYKKAKLSFFKYIQRSKKIKKRKNDEKETNKILAVNRDDKYASEFLNFNVDEKYVYSLNDQNKDFTSLDSHRAVNVSDYKLSDNGSKFIINGMEFDLHLPGKFNIYNVLAAVCATQSQGIDMNVAKRAIEKIKSIPGRMEFINEGQPFRVVVDYAHTPEALNSVYETLLSVKSKSQITNSKMICVLGAAGGGRDKWKRPEFGKIAAEYCDEIILTDEDPYNENPEKILNDIFSGFSQITNRKSPASAKTTADGQITKILDRREAIKRALSLAKSNDVVIITGKGAENKMMIGDGSIAWDDRLAVKEELKKMLE